MWAETDVDGVEFMDDWGSQTSLLIAPELWREVFRPLYREYCQILHAKDKWVFFHSDGNISDIFGDLVEIGVDAVNSQLFCMDMDRLAQQFRGQVTFWGEIDRQRLLPFGTSREVRAAVDRVRTALDFGRGGLIAQCEWGLDVPFDNIAAVYDAWQHPLPMHLPRRCAAKCEEDRAGHKPAEASIMPFALGATVGLPNRVPSAAGQASSGSRRDRAESHDGGPGHEDTCACPCWAWFLPGCSCPQRR